MEEAFKSFHAMTTEDYAAIGLRCGVEVHQQLLTDRKLFCRCPAGWYSDEYDAEILRHMRPTLSELGEYDGTALMEKKTRKNIYYRLNRQTVCTYESDDTPPFGLNQQALDIAIEIALLLQLNMVGELHIARKQYLDGSIPTGFQRTTILGVDGWIPYRDRRIRVAQLGLEEDSCREVSDVGHDRVYLTDRLGMPLIEVVTLPDMRTPQETAEVVQVIRWLCRSTGKVRRGYGAARQDVNVSVEGGTRIEIKGVPQVGRIPRLIYNEARRQWSLLRIRTRLAQRGIALDTLQATSFEVTRLLTRTQYEPIRAALDAGLCVRCVALGGFAGILNISTQEQTTFARELSDRVRVIACLTHSPNIIHSDSASDSLTGREWKAIRKKARAGSNDALVLVWGSERDAMTACEEIIIRAREATVGVPSDTRQALKDGTNGFERVLPGPERMYPDTDLPPIVIGEARLAGVRARLPEAIWTRRERYRAMGVPQDTLDELAISPRAPLFDELVATVGISPTFAAVVLVQRFRALRRSGGRPDAIAVDDLRAVFRAFADGRLTRCGVVEAIGELAKACAADKSAVDVVRTLERFSAPPLSDSQLSARVLGGIHNHNDNHAWYPTAMHKHRYTMGRVMRDLCLCAEGERVARCLDSALASNVVQ